ncbi:MAG: hypothetical protein V7K21_27025 [Nostoc sp.]|uniref:hypothetical protein n=1 Tax=Nostoc sp. TaxID=1180 RepID=UPI002FF6D08F
MKLFVSCLAAVILPTLKQHGIRPMATEDGTPVEVNIRIAQEAIRQRIEQAIKASKILQVETNSSRFTPMYLSFCAILYLTQIIL